MPNRKELESTICDIEKKLAEHEAVFKQKVISLRHAQEDLKEKQDYLTYHHNNVKFMDQKATLVDIKEYRGVLKLQAHAKANVAAAAIKVRDLTSAVGAYRREIDNANGEIAKARLVLEEFGQVLSPSVPHWRKS